MASALIEFVDCKKLMVCIDLDHTLWDTSCFEHTASPYERFEESDPTVKSVMYTNRKDGTRCKLSLYPEAFEILDWCRQQGIALSICSKSQQSDAARGILTALDMWSYFQFPQIYNRRKSTHFKQLKECTDLEYSNFLFFDDDIMNVEMCSVLGVVAEKVNPVLGLTQETFLRGLTSFAMKHMTTTAHCNPAGLRNDISGPTAAVTPPLQSEPDTVSALTGHQFLSSRSLYRPYEHQAVPVPTVPTPLSTSAPTLTPGLIPHRMSGIHLDNYKFLMPLDMSAPESGMQTAEVSEASEPEDEDSTEVAASAETSDHLILSF